MTLAQYEERIRVLQAYGCTPEDLCDEAERVMGACRRHGPGARVNMIGSRAYVAEVFRLVAPDVARQLTVVRFDPPSLFLSGQVSRHDVGCEEYRPEVAHPYLVSEVAPA